MARRHGLRASEVGGPQGRTSSRWTRSGVSLQREPRLSFSGSSTHLPARSLKAPPPWWRGTCRHVSGRPSGHVRRGTLPPARSRCNTKRRKTSHRAAAGERSGAAAHARVTEERRGARPVRLRRRAPSRRSTPRRVAFVGWMGRDSRQPLSPTRPAPRSSPLWCRAH